MRILVVEDDAPLRDFLSKSLSKIGLEVKVAKNGRIGLELFQTFSPEIVLTDIRMPVMDGLDLLSEIRKRSDNAIVIVMTAFGCEEYVFEALHRRANNYLSKPVRLDDLIRLINKYGSLLKSRKIPRDKLGQFIHRKFTVLFDNRIDLIPKMANRLLIESGDSIPPDCRLGIHLGLAELLANAIEHGNFGISYQEKTDALKNPDSAFLEKIYHERFLDDRIRKKKVSVRFTMEKNYCQWIIEDEGKGFDWHSLPQEQDENTFMELHGRGVFLSRLQFDELEFLGKGNRVRVLKKIHQLNSKRQRQ